MLRLMMMMTLGSVLLVGCGQKGPLYLPEDPQSIESQSL